MIRTLNSVHFGNVLQIRFADRGKMNEYIYYPIYYRYIGWGHTSPHDSNVLKMPPQYLVGNINKREDGGKKEIGL